MSFHKKALYTDMTQNYLTPVEPMSHTRVKVRFRTGRGNVDRVTICYNGQKAIMRKDSFDDIFDYYAYHIRLTDEPIYYHFEVEAEDESCYYNRLGISKSEEARYDFILVPGFATPDWAKGAVVYQIYVDRFYNGDSSNDVVNDEYYYQGRPVKHAGHWNDPVSRTDEGTFYGGDLQGIIDKMDYLEGLGVEVLYLNPIFVSPSSHKYDIQDYSHIDPHFGKIVNREECGLKDGYEQYRGITTDRENLEASDRLFVRLVEEAHKRGMKVILDGVFYCCGSWHRFMDKEGIYANGDTCSIKGAYQDSNSPYREYFQYKNPQDANSYENWWGYEAYAKFNYENSRKLYEYILSVAVKWVSKPFCADGWRVDVAASVGNNREWNHHFWQDFRKAVKTANPEALIIAEHYGPAKSWLMGGEWDSVMNCEAFMEPVSWFLTGMERHANQYRREWLGNSDIFWTSVETGNMGFTNQCAVTAMNELSNHDNARFLTRTNHTVGRIENMPAQKAELGVSKAVLREAVIMQMTWPGSPVIYYGDEAGVCGFTDPDSRRTYPWGHEDKELIGFYRAMIRIHKQNPELKTGSILVLYAQPYVTAYARFTQKEQIIVIVNCGESIKDISMPIWQAGIPVETTMERIMVTTRDGYNTESAELPVHRGKLKVSLLPQSGIVLKHRNKKLAKQRNFLKVPIDFHSRF